MIDLDDFKAINDNFGHDAGDEVLLETVKRNKGAVSRSFSQETASFPILYKHVPTDNSL